MSKKYIIIPERINNRNKYTIYCIKKIFGFTYLKYINDSKYLVDAKRIVENLKPYDHKKISIYELN